MTDSPIPEPRKQVAAERNDLAIGWVAAVMFGAIAISVVPESAGVVRLLAPLAAMGGFLFFALTRQRFSKPKVADSMYFMGFIWTLWALIDVLVGNPQMRAAELYVAFGYALTATTAGMFSRLIILQFYRSFDDQEGEATDAIDERVAKLSEELVASQQHLAELRGGASATVLKWHAEFERASEEQLASFSRVATSFETESAALVDAVKSIRASVSITGRAFNDAEKKLSAAAERISVDLSKAVETFESRVLELSARLQAIDVPADVFTKAMAAPLANLSNAVRPVQELALVTLRDLHTAVTQVSNAVRTLPHSAELESATAGVISHLHAVSKATTAFAAEARSAVDAIVLMRHAARQTEDLSHQAGNRVAREAQNAAAALTDIGKAARDTSTVIKDVVHFVQSELPKR